MNQLQTQQARLNQLVMSDNFGPTALVLEGLRGPRGAAGPAALPA